MDRLPVISNKFFRIFPDILFVQQGDLFNILKGFKLLGIEMYRPE